MKCKVIAEAGVNHNGKIKLAKKLIDIASNSGADFVKFQSFNVDNLVTKTASKANYQIKNTNNANETQYSMLKKLELTEDHHKFLISYCKKKNIRFLSTPFDIDSAKLLHDLKLKHFKIPSGEITNFPLLDLISRMNKKIFLSTGMSNLKEIKNAINILINSGSNIKNITVLHCNTSYPTPYEDVNLNAMITIKKKLKVDVGYSDHTLGIEVPVAAVAMGASIIEKHFTISRKLKGPDHKASLEPEELKNMIVSIKNISKALGSYVKKPTKSEKPNINIARKSIVAIQQIRKGETFSKHNIGIKRPGFGLHPKYFNKLIGKKSKKSYRIDQLIKI